MLRYVQADGNGDNVNNNAVTTVTYQRCQDSLHSVTWGGVRGILE